MRKDYVWFREALVRSLLPLQGIVGCLRLSRDPVCGILPNVVVVVSQRTSWCHEGLFPVLAWRPQQPQIHFLPRIKTKIHIFFTCFDFSPSQRKRWIIGPRCVIGRKSSDGLGSGGPSQFAWRQSLCFWSAWVSERYATLRAQTRRTNMEEVRSCFTSDTLMLSPKTGFLRFLQIGFPVQTLNAPNSLN